MVDDLSAVKDSTHAQGSFLCHHLQRPFCLLGPLRTEVYSGLPERPEIMRLLQRLRVEHEKEHVVA